MPRQTVFRSTFHIHERYISIRDYRCIAHRLGRVLNLVAQSCLTLWDPMSCCLPGSSVHELFQARILEWVAISFSRGSSWPRAQTHVSWIFGIVRQILYHWATWEVTVRSPQMSHWRDNSTNKCPPPSLGLHTQHSPDSMEIAPHLNAISEKTGLKWPWGGLDEVSAPGEIRTLSGKKVSYIFFFFTRLCVLRLLLAVFILLLITLKDLRPSFSNSQQAGSLAQCSVMT